MRSGAVLLPFVALFGVCPVFAQHPTATNAAAIPFPRVICDNPDYDFGQCDEGTNLVHDFILRNQGTASLTVTAVRASCGCTATTLGTNVVAAGGQTALRVALSLRGLRGPLIKSVTAESNDPVQPRLSLKLKGTATVELGLEPAYLSFGFVPGNSEATREVRLVGRRPGAKITGAACDSTNFLARPKAGQSEWGVAFDVFTVPPLAAGEVRGTLTVTTDQPDKAALKTPVFAIVQGEVRVFPKALVLQGTSGERLARSVFLYPGSISNYHVLQVDIPLEGARSDVQSTGPGAYRVDLTNLTVAADLRGKFVRILTDLPEMKEISLPIQVILQP